MSENPYFIIDVSHWDPQVDWGLLASKNVVCAMVKATEKTNYFDELFQTHCNGAKAAGLILGAYHFFSPYYDGVAQAEYFMNNISSQPIKIMALDFEEYWGKNPANKISQSTYSQRALNMVTHITQNSTLPLVMYTRRNFIVNEVPAMLSWLPQYQHWLAHWRYNATDLNTPPPIVTTWEDYVANHLPPAGGPTPLPGCTSWTLWQFTGEKFLLPGITTKIDLNYYNGTKEQFLQYANVTIPPTHPTLPHTVRLVAFVRVHSKPDMDPTTIVGQLDNTARPTGFEVFSTAGDTYVRIGDQQWIPMKYKGIKFADWE